MGFIRTIRTSRAWLLTAMGVALMALVACGGDDDSSGGTLTIGGIPDQDVSALEAQFGAVVDYLEAETGLDVEYVPSNDYAAIVTAFQRGDVQLAWFGGLTGVQARAVTEAHAVAQRPRDAEFQSVFIVNSDVDATTLEDLRGLTFTFGSESSTSGHLMPRYFMLEAGIDADADLDGPPGFSGSHDATYELVQSGAFQAGALNQAVWEAAVRDGKVDTNAVRVLLETPPYYDYNWSIREDVDDTLGDGTTDKIVEALLHVGESDEASAAQIVESFGGGAEGGFIATSDENYDAIRDVAKQLGIIE
ncbi:MAG: putative selenate ABC transporter substrate-binding protein [Dehalococcoidia bacterium]